MKKYFRHITVKLSEETLFYNYCIIEYYHYNETYMKNKLNQLTDNSVKYLKYQFYVYKTISL
jgi:hypothetical protein